MSKNLEQQVKDFHDSHKDLTGPDAGTKISEDLFKATQGMSEQQKRDFYIGLDHSDSPFEKVNYDFKDTNNNGVRDSLIVNTEYDAHPWIPGVGLTFQKTNATEEIGKLQAQKESMKRPGTGSGTGSILERGKDNWDKTNQYVDQKFDK